MVIRLRGRVWLVRGLRGGGLALSGLVIAWGYKRPKFEDGLVFIYGVKRGLFYDKPRRPVWMDVKHQLLREGVLTKKYRKAWRRSVKSELWKKKKRRLVPGSKDQWLIPQKKKPAHNAWKFRESRTRHETIYRTTFFGKFKYHNWLMKRKHNKVSASDPVRTFFNGYFGDKMNKGLCSYKQFRIVNILKHRQRYGVHSISSFFESRNRKYFYRYRVIRHLHIKQVKRSLKLTPRSKFLSRHLQPFAHYLQYSPRITTPKWRSKVVHRWGEKRIWKKGKRRNIIFGKADLSYNRPARRHRRRWFKPKYGYEDVKWFVSHQDPVTKNKSGAASLKAHNLDVHRRFKNTYIILDQGPESRAYSPRFFNTWQPLWNLNREQRVLRDKAIESLSKIGGGWLGFGQLSAFLVSAFLGGAWVILCYQGFRFRWRYVKLTQVVRDDKTLWTKLKRISCANRTGFWEVVVLGRSLIGRLLGIFLVWVSVYYGVHAFLKIEIETTLFEIFFGSCLSLFVYRKFFRTTVKRFVQAGRWRIRFLAGWFGATLFKRLKKGVKYRLYVISWTFAARWLWGSWRLYHDKLEDKWDVLVKYFYWDYLRYLNFNNKVKPRSVSFMVKRHKEEVYDLWKRRKPGYYLMWQNKKHEENILLNYAGTKCQKRSFVNKRAEVGSQFKPKIDLYRYDVVLENIGKDILGFLDPVRAVRYAWGTGINWLGERLTLDERMVASLEYFKLDKFTQVSVKKRFFPGLVTEEEEAFYQARQEKIRRAFGYKAKVKKEVRIAGVDEWKNVQDKLSTKAFKKIIKYRQRKFRDKRRHSVDWLDTPV
jgi:hypothetical protein